ncbi:MAG: class I SAM-dependent methyltransferase [Desulfobacteraceae bacterium]|nr:class I SAM-dependent methyltransferase [Desulfobacteraceae bacterium]
MVGFFAFFTHFKKEIKRLLPKSFLEPIRRIWYQLLLLDYYRTIITGKPYFGFIYAADQLNPRRANVMKAILLDELEKQPEIYNILEVGSWAGASTNLWASLLKQRAPPPKKGGVVVCIDPWDIYTEIAAQNYPKQHNRKRMIEAVKSGSILRLFVHNLKALGNYGYVRFFRGYSQDILPLVKNESFEFIYIDGNHSYEAVRADIREAKRIVKDGGIICGDDLEKQRDELPRRLVDPESEEYLDPVSLDYSAISDGKAAGHETGCHYGVTMAVWDEFGHVSALEGVWAVRRVGTCFEQVILKPKIS